MGLGRGTLKQGRGQLTLIVPTTRGDAVMCDLVGGTLGGWFHQAQQMTQLQAWG